MLTSWPARLAESDWIEVLRSHMSATRETKMELATEQYLLKHNTLSFLYARRSVMSITLAWVGGIAATVTHVINRLHYADAMEYTYLSMRILDITFDSEGSLYGNR